MKGGITKKLIMTYSLVLAVFLFITALLLNITARASLENNIIKNLHTESAIIEELYRERAGGNSYEEDSKQDIRRIREHIKSWFMNIKKLADIGFSSDFALVIRRDESKFGIFTPGESQNELDFKEIEPADLARKLKAEPYLFRITGGDTAYFAVSRPLSDSKGKSGAVKSWIIAYTPVGELNRLVGDMNLKAAYAVVVALAVSAVLSYIIAKSISKPIKSLKAHAERIASRDFKTRVHLATGDEIENLAEAMNKIAGDLNDYDLAQKRFLQNVSHELKTPVMSIMGYAEGIKDQVIENKEKALDIIIGECERLQRLVNEVLFLSKLETVEEFYSFKSEKLNAILDVSLEKIQSLAETAGIELVRRFDRDCVVEMDGDKFIQAMLNLLSNGIRYARTKVIVETSLVPLGVQIRVIDDGPGISEEELPRVFERFYKGRKGSTGLGMTITKAIVEKHKGSIAAANGQDGGAVFTLVLPVKG